MLLYSAQVKVRRLLGMGRSAGRGGAPRDTHARAGVLRTPTASRRGRPDCSEPRPGVHLCTRGGVTRSRRPALPPARALTLVHECLSSSTPERGARPLQRRRRTDGRGLESQRLRGARREIGAQRPGHSAGATGARGARNDGDVVLARNAPEEDRTRGTLIRELPCWRERGDRITRRGCTGVASALSAPWRARITRPGGPPEPLKRHPSGCTAELRRQAHARPPPGPRGGDAGRRTCSGAR